MNYMWLRLFLIYSTILVEISYILYLFWTGQIEFYRYYIVKVATIPLLYFLELLGEIY